MTDMAHSTNRVSEPPVGEMVASVRKRNGLTQEELAKLLTKYGWSKSSTYAVYKIECGTRGVTPHELAILAAALDCTMAHLLGESERRRKARHVKRD